MSLAVLLPELVQQDSDKDMGFRGSHSVISPLPLGGKGRGIFSFLEENEGNTYMGRSVFSIFFYSMNKYL